MICPECGGEDFAAEDSWVICTTQGSCTFCHYMEKEDEQTISKPAAD